MLPMVLSQDHTVSTGTIFPLFLVSLGNCLIDTIDLLASTFNNFWSFKSQRGSNSKPKLLGSSAQNAGDSLSDEQFRPTGQGMSSSTLKGSVIVCKHMLRCFACIMLLP